MLIMTPMREKKTDAVINDPVNDPVNHPSYYNGHKIEVIDFLEDWSLPFHLANCVEYICRAGRKSKETLIQDLEKAEWYLKRYISLLKKEREAQEGSE